MNEKTRDTKVLLFLIEMDLLTNKASSPSLWKERNWIVLVFGGLFFILVQGFVCFYFLTVMPLQHTKQYSLGIKDTLQQTDHFLNPWLGQDFLVCIVQNEIWHKEGKCPEELTGLANWEMKKESYKTRAETPVKLRQFHKWPSSHDPQHKVGAQIRTYHKLCTEIAHLST